MAGKAGDKPVQVGNLRASRKYRIAAGGNKLGAKKTEDFLADGTPHTFDSKRERDRYHQLSMMEKAGMISNLRIQVPYELVPPQKKSDGTVERALSYVADFVYSQNGETVVEDVKGYRGTASAVYRVFVIKRKLMLWRYGIAVREV